MVHLYRDLELLYRPQTRQAEDAKEWRTYRFFCARIGKVRYKRETLQRVMDIVRRRRRRWRTGIWMIRLKESVVDFKGLGLV